MLEQGIMEHSKFRKKVRKTYDRGKESTESFSDAVTNGIRSHHGVLDLLRRRKISMAVNDITLNAK